MVIVALSSCERFCHPAPLFTIEYNLPPQSKLPLEKTADNLGYNISLHELSFLPSMGGVIYLVLLYL